MVQNGTAKQWASSFIKKNIVHETAKVIYLVTSTLTLLFIVRLIDL